MPARPRMSRPTAVTALARHQPRAPCWCVVQACRRKLTRWWMLWQEECALNPKAMHSRVDLSKSIAWPPLKPRRHLFGTTQTAVLWHRNRILGLTVTICLAKDRAFAVLVWDVCQEFYQGTRASASV
eukprot:3034370-Rhodomonas_salina.2